MSLDKTPTLETRKRPGQLAAELLQNVLANWEEKLLLAECGRRRLSQEYFGVDLDDIIGKGKGPPWKEFRRFLLRGPFEEDTPEKVEKHVEGFLVSEDAKESEVAALTKHAHAKGQHLDKVSLAGPLTEVHNIDPLLVAAFMWQGRRAYRLQVDDQLLFPQLTFSDWTWDQIKMPFKSFLIELPVPIQSPADSRMRVAALLITNLHKVAPVSVPEGRFECMPLYLNDGKISSGLTANEKKLVEQYSIAGNWNAANEIAKKLYDYGAGLRKIPKHPVFYVNRNENVTSPDVSDFTNVLRKIVAATSLLLVHANIPEPSLPKRPKGKSGTVPGPVITKPEEVFELKLEGTIQPASLIRLRKTHDATVLTPTPVAGYFRRPPYSEPTAERTVFVEDHLRGKRFIIGREALPLGTRMKFKES